MNKRIKYLPIALSVSSTLSVTASWKFSFDSTPMSPFHGKLKRSVIRWKIKERSWRTFHRRTNVLESKIFEFYDWEGGIFLRFVVSGQQELECFALDFDLEIDRKSKFLIRKELKRNLLFHWIINLSRYDVRNTLYI